jgi:putative NADH-flavin reductase
MLSSRRVYVMSTNVAKPAKVAIIGASGTYGTGILARAEEIGVEAVVITRSPHKFKYVKPTTTVIEAQLDEEEKMKEAFTGCDGVISALGDDRKKRPKMHNLPHVWNAMKAAGVKKYIGMGPGPMNCSIHDHGDFCLYCVVSSEWDKLAPHT